MAIEMRDRLVETIKQAEQQFSNTGRPVLDIEEYVADYLLADGWIRPPLNNVISAKQYSSLKNKPSRSLRK